MMARKTSIEPWGCRACSPCVPPPKLPMEALQEMELRRWVPKLGEHVARLVRTPLGANLSTVAYESSEMELKWLTGTVKGSLCATAGDPTMKANAQAWLHYSTQAGVWSPAERPSMRPTAEQAAVLSHFIVRVDEYEHKEPIEPLHGIGRHPFARVGCSESALGRFANLFDITYLVLHNDCHRQQGRLANPKPRVVLFDMGVSEGFNNIPGGIPKTVHNGGGISPSMPLFYRMYQDRCLEPDAVFGWEINKKITATAWWGDAGPDIRRKVRFFEVPVEEGELHEAIKGSRNPSSFLQMLKAEVTQDDFVAVKLDIDTPAIEQTIIGALTQRPDLASLIDELFFEYHFYFDGLSFGWGSNVNGDVDTALATMHRLRELGIRAHFWI